MIHDDRSPGGVHTGLLGMTAVAADTQEDTAQSISVQAQVHTCSSPTKKRLTLRERGYHPVPISGPEMNVRSAGKRPMMPQWERRCLGASAEEIEGWAVAYADSINTGLLCGTLVGVDIDVLQAHLSNSIANLAWQILGPTPLVRFGQEPKALLVYRLQIPIDKLQTAALFFTDNPKEKATKIELLGRGQQFVGFGIHPETLAPYRWHDASPLTIDFADLPETTEEALRHFLVEAERILRGAGAVTRSEQKEIRTRETKGRRAAGVKVEARPDHETIGDALNHIPNEFDYDGWIRIGFALYDGLGEAGREHWETWSATSPNNDAAFTSGKWSSFAGGRSVGVATLFWHAMENGWKRQGRAGAPKQDRTERTATPDPDAQPKPNDGRPIVQFIAGLLAEVVDRMETLLIGAGVELYSRAGTLVRPVINTVPAANGRKTTVARMCPLITVSLADMASRVIRFQRFDARAQDWLNINPPVEVTAALLAREGEWRIPPVVGVISTPTLRPDGTLLSAPGYDPATRLYLALDPSFALPRLNERPDQDDARKALQYIENLLLGFPFVGPTDKAVALSGILTALVRGVLPTAPLHAIRAHSPGTGKSFLVDLIALIATGRPCPVIAAGKTEEETEKRLGALLLNAVPIISIDNVNGELGGDMLCQLTERPLVRVRILGKSEAPELECRSAVFATGNNLVLLGDMTRRTLVCSLDAGVERPELRKFDFDPLSRVRADRGQYVGAALTVIRGYRAAGSPPVCKPFGPYEDWTAMVRAPLIWLGHPDPVVSTDTVREEDPELSAIRELFGHWQRHLGLSSPYTTSAISQKACEKRHGADYGTQEFVNPEFRDLLLRQAGDSGAVSSKRLGKWLSQIKGRVVVEHRIEMRVDASNGNRFTLCKVGPPLP